MKIRKLIINGFGPYATRQELDFEKNLHNKNMFVITGNTGAGKTTIFDAINFALYGEASGSDRDGKSFRSDFADQDTPTEVELWFSLRGKEYYVKRTPAYFKPKKRGEGFVENKATAEIRLSKDKTITGAKEVTKEVENILGITTEQFKQLVMIPQGEFKRLLNAKSEEKEEIFRKIFGTEVFDRIQRQIKEQSNQLKRGIEQVERDRLNKIKSFICKDKDEELLRLINANEPNIELIIKKFYESIEEDKAEQIKIEASIKEKSTLVEKLSNEIALGEATNKKFNNLQKNKEELNKLNEQLEEYKGKKLQVERGKKALTAKTYEDKYNEKNRNSKKLNLEINEIENNILSLKESFLKAEKQFNDQKAREDEKSKLNAALDENKRLKEKALVFETQKGNVEALEKKVKAVKANISNIGLAIDKNDKNIDLINKELEEVKKAKDEKGALEIQELNCKSKKDKLNKLNNDINLWINEKAKHEKEEYSFNKLDQSFKASKERYEFLEDAFRKNQAGILASTLQEGSPCPVCGSIHHPELAKIENSEITDAAAKASKDAMEKIRGEKDEKLNELTNIYASLRSIKENSINPAAKELFNKEAVDNVNEFSIEVNDLYKSNNTKLAVLKGKIEDLNSIINKESEKLQSLQSMQKNNNNLRKELQLKNQELVAEEGKLSAAKNTLEIIKQEFNSEIKTVSELDAIAKALSKELQDLKKSYEECEKAFNLIKGSLDQENGKYQEKKHSKERCHEELKEAVEIFKEKVLSLGFKGYEDYKSSSLSEEEIGIIEKDINEFNIKLAGAKSLYEASIKEVEGLKTVDLSALKEKLDSENNILKAFDKEKLDILIRIKNNKAVVKACEDYTKAIEKDEKKYEVVGKLSNIINGDNSKKISFERYVLAAYFEDIIAAANLRFNKMTSGRFELLRKQVVGDKRKGQGLDLEVFDNYTGKARDVKTLSGGESFKASLSMALGLADVVQAYSGGIQLDTMFIDEGFGTLDPESLDNSIECLMDLQNDGRLVGIISHVPELKERIAARLMVSSTSRGSVAEFRV